MADDINPNILSSFKDIHSQKGRYAYIGKYKIDRLFFQLSMYAIFAFLLYIAWSNNFNLDYYQCSAEFNGVYTVAGETITNLCHNPFYTPSTWKNMEYLPSGEYGTKPGRLFNMAGSVAFGLIFLAFLLNHIIYNRGSICPKKKY